MKKQNFTETQTCLPAGRYSGMESSHIKELKDLKEENRRLKQMYAELMLDHQLAKHIIEKKL
jgi:putative transposase